MSLARIGRWFVHAAAVRYDRRAIPRQSLKGWRGVWHCIDMALWFMRWAAAGMAVAAAVLAVVYPPESALLRESRDGSVLVFLGARGPASSGALSRPSGIPCLDLVAATRSPYGRPAEEAICGWEWMIGVAAARFGVGPVEADRLCLDAEEFREVGEGQVVVGHVCFLGS